MKKLTIVSVLFIVAFGFSQNQNTALEKDSIAMHYANTITVKDLKEDLTILASDALEGRETGKRGQKMAAAFIRAHFENLGLVGPVKNGPNPYYQNVYLKSSKPGDIYVKIGDTKLKNLEDVLYYGDPTVTDEISSEVVFVGAGTEEDFKDIDVKGKSVLLINTNRAARRKATKLAYQHGAQMVFILRATSDEEFGEALEMFANYFGKESLTLADEKNEKSSVGAFYISPSNAEAIFGESFDTLLAAIENKANGKIKSGKVSYKIEFETKDIISENVLGYLEGSEFKDEVIVMTAHYDHEGIKNGEIYNGADDDGSGTVALMDIAEAFVKAKEEGNGPRRSILFMTVTGEEKGLLGSEYYTDNPIFPLENTVVDLNIDMVGRIGTVFEDKGEYVRLVGSDAISTELHNINEMANEMYTNLYLDYTYNDPSHPERIYYRSDHWNFAKNGIPIIFYGNGAHADYHKPTDTVDKIIFELLQKRAKLIFHTAWIVANRDNRLIIDKEMDPNAKR